MPWFTVQFPVQGEETVGMIYTGGCSTLGFKINNNLNCTNRDCTWSEGKVKRAWLRTVNQGSLVPLIALVLVLSTFLSSFYHQVESQGPSAHFHGVQKTKWVDYSLVQLTIYFAWDFNLKRQWPSVGHGVRANMLHPLCSIISYWVATFILKFSACQHCWQHPLSDSVVGAEQKVATDRELKMKPNECFERDILLHWWITLKENKKEGCFVLKFSQRVRNLMADLSVFLVSPAVTKF